MSYERFLFELARCETIDESASANSHTYVCPAPMLLEHLVCEYVSSATAGNRTVAFRITDAADAVLAEMAGDVAQAASLTRRYVFGRGLPADAAFVNGVLQRPTHLYRLEQGWKLVTVDAAGIDAADTQRVIATVRRVPTSI